jgi:chromosomal replication initiation ATPase DnaA
MNNDMTRAREALAQLNRSYGRFLLDAQRAMDAINHAATPALVPLIDDARAQRIIGTVAAEYQVAPDLLLCRVRTATISEARHVAMVLCRELLGHSQAETATSFRRDHGTVVFAERNVRNWLESEPAFKARFDCLRTACERALAVATLEDSAA